MKDIRPNCQKPKGGCMTKRRILGILFVTLPIWGIVGAFAYREDPLIVLQSLGVLAGIALVAALFMLGDWLLE